MPNPDSLAILRTPAAHLLAAALLHFIWQGLALAALVSLLLLLFNARQARIRYALCFIGLLAMAACPIATFTWLALAISSAEELDTQAITSPVIDRVLSATRWSDLVASSEPYLLALWLGGVLLLATRLVIGALGVARLRRSKLPLPPKVLALAEELGQRLRTDASRLVFQSAQTAEAMAVGLFRPMVLIPASWLTEMPLDVLEAVIAHELAHLVRGDLWVNFLQRLVETLLFYHPAVWWLSARLRSERELCADELAIAVTGKRLEYVRALERVAAQRHADIRPALAAFLRGEMKMRLLQRIHYLLGQRERQCPSLWPAGVVALALPLSLWALASVGDVASGQEVRDEPKPTFRRERFAESQQRRREGEEGERDAGDSSKRATTQVREERYVISRDGEEPQEVKRRTIVRDGKPVVEVELGIEDGKRPAGDRRIEELTVLVKRLAAQVERLQDEVAQLRGGGSDKPTDKLTLRTDGSRPRIVRDRKPATEVDERKIIERKLIDEAGLERKIKESVEQADLAKQRAAEQLERADQLKKEAAQQKERVQKEVEQAVRKKVEAAREKAEAEIKELEKKLEKLKEGKLSGVKEDIDIELEFVPKIRQILLDQQSLIK